MATEPPKPPARCPHIFAEARCIHRWDRHPVALGGRRLAHEGWLSETERIAWTTPIKTA